VPFGTRGSFLRKENTMNTLNLFKWLVTKKTHVISTDGKNFLDELEGKPARILVCLSENLANDSFVGTFISSYQKEFPNKLFTVLHEGKANDEAFVVDTIFNVNYRRVDEETVAVEFFDTFTEFLSTTVEHWIYPNILNNQVLFCFTKLSPYNINPYLMRNLFTHIIVDPDLKEDHHPSIASSFISLGLDAKIINKVQNMVCDELLRNPIQDALTLSSVFANDHAVLSKDMDYRLDEFLYDMVAYCKYEKSILKSPLVKITPNLTYSMKSACSILPLEILCLGTYHYTNSPNSEYAKTKTSLAIDYNPERLVHDTIKSLLISICRDEVETDEDIEYVINKIFEIAKK